MMSVLNDSKSKELACQFIYEFISEQYQKENATEMLLYKDKDSYRVMARIDKSIEDWIVQITKNAVPTIWLEELYEWMDEELYDELQYGRIDMEACAQRMQHKAEELLQKK